MAWNKRVARRVEFQDGIAVRIVGADGSWTRDCTMLDISETGVLLSRESSMDGLDIRVFFLVFAGRGLAHRRCELARSDANTIGARFVQAPGKR
jgi:hypothetical protein